ncbi:MAG TPA: two-component regulator propeller domain-containing protein [Bryobacteraceae bacterium]|nr:two-component regulator propeller domain-containing protein [Bryobacteraceae bacterium]
MKNLNTSRKKMGAILKAAALLAILFAGPCYAIDPHRALSQYIYDRWGAEQGFPLGSVYGITQTPDGYLWIGTEAGLLRFDGIEFRPIHGQPGTYPFTSVLSLSSDRDGSLWLRLKDRTLLRYRNGAVGDPFYRTGPATNITAMGRTNQGELLVARMQFGAFTYRNGELALIAPAAGVPRSPIISIAQTGDGAVWMGTRGAGLVNLQGGITSVITHGLPDPKINCLLPDGVKNLWIGTDHGLAYWNGSEVTTKGIPAALSGLQILALTKDRDGNLWVGTDSGKLMRFNSDGVATLDRGAGDSGNAITAIFEDREGDLWFGSANRLERLRDSPFVTYSTPEGLPADGSKPVFVDSENRTWFAPSSGGLWWFNSQHHRSVLADGLDKDVVYSIAGGKNELWVGRQRGGLTRITSQLTSPPGGFEAKTYSSKDGLAQDSVYSVYWARDGSVWAGTLSGGVSRLDAGTFKTYTIADGLASNTVASILESSDGTMWFATPNGLSSLAKGHWRTFTSAEGLPSPNVNCLLEDSTGVLWAGTTAGLAFQHSGHFQIPTRVPAFLKEQILGLAEDRNGALWIATSNHVMRVNRDKLLQGGLGDGDLRQYGLADGLRGTEGVKRQTSVVADSVGRIWFSLNAGISVVDPARLTRTFAPAIPHIEAISADGSRIGISGDVHVPSNRQRVVIRYTGLSLSVPERVRFRYWLEGFDRGWSDSGANREAVYTNLPPASYRFHLMAANPDGVWNEKEADVSFAVDPAYWQTRWFRAGILLLCALIALILYRLRLTYVTQQLSLRFEERLAERTRIAQELHDTLLQGFISASMQVHVAASKLPADSNVKTSLARSLDVMRQVIDEARNAVRGLRYDTGIAVDLEQAFSQIREEVVSEGIGGESIDFRVVAEGRRIELHPVLNEEVYRIGREALINAFRHSRAKKIEMELNYSSGGLRILVRDDGRGIDPQLLREGRDGHWGLAGIRERADRIGGRLRLWSSLNGGTEVELWVPGHIAFAHQSRPANAESRQEILHTEKHK